jgi:hypothetical protein
VLRLGFWRKFRSGGDIRDVRRQSTGVGASIKSAGWWGVMAVGALTDSESVLCVRVRVRLYIGALAHSRSHNQQCAGALAAHRGALAHWRTGVMGTVLQDQMDTFRAVSARR